MFELIYSSKAMQRVDKLISLAASINRPVLIEGESGSGKEIVARLIFERSKTSKNAFVIFNCTAIPESLAQSVLFGYERGAFTGANSRKLGLFQAANGGTLFLDEIADLSVSLQAMLLRAVQFGEVQPIGAVKPMTVQVRLIAATNKSIEDEIRQGSFRLDLYFRISLIRIVLPPLRERPEDIPVLAEHFLRRYCAEYHSAPKRLTEDALNMLRAHSYPGNVRELENKIEKAIILTEGHTISAKDLRFDEVFLDAPTSGWGYPAKELWTLSLPDAMGTFEKDYLKRCLDRAGGSVSHAARLAGVHRVTFARKLQRYGIHVESD